MSKKYEIDMTSGSMLKNIIRFSVPLMFTGILQLLYSAADIAVVGRFAGSDALAAVGSTSSLTNLLVNLFMGFATGTSVLVSIAFGSRNAKKVSDTVHTAMALSIICGIVVGLLVIVISKPVLTLMGTPAEVLPKSVLYMRIIFMGIPAVAFFNFGSAILRSVGDTKRPLYFLTISGIVNVLVNLLLVIVFKMGVEGVAIATILSQYISACLITLCLTRSTDSYRLVLKKIKLKKDRLLEILRIGIPAALQGCLFSFSNMLIQSSINLFGAAAMAGSSVGSNIEGFIYTSMNSVYQAAITATGQNLGAKKIKGIRKAVVTCALVVATIGILLTVVINSIRSTAIGIYTTDPVVAEYTVVKLTYVMLPYVLCGIMEVFAGIMRGLGYAITPMLVSLIGACGIRVLWIMTAFQMSKTLETLYLCYPVSWTLTSLAHLICIIVALRKLKKSFKNEGITEL